MRRRAAARSLLHSAGRSSTIHATARTLPRVTRNLCLLILTVAISACASTGRQISDAGRSTPEHAGVAVHGSADAGERIARQALAMLGTPYRYGGASPQTGFDCSGLVWYSFLQSGIDVPRTAREQYRSARKIALRDAIEGDVLFFEDEEMLSHIGIYVGGGRFVHAPASGRTVSVASLDGAYYQRHLVGVGRLLP